MKTGKVVVENHADGYVAYPLGIEGGVVGQGETYEEALADVRSALAFHLESLGATAVHSQSVIEVFVAEGTLGIP